MNQAIIENSAFGLVAATAQLTPLVVDSPHSCRIYPDDFTPIATESELLTSWDAWVDELLASAPQVGAPLLVANFPRFYLDLNRARDDIDPQLLIGGLPFPLRPTSKSDVGMGLIRRLALPGIPVYANPLSALEVACRIERYYDPYYEELGRLMDEAHDRFGRVVHLDCHSMKSRGNAMNDDPGEMRPDVVVSDGDGTCADPELTNSLAELFRQQGLSTSINMPYKGAELIRRFSDVKNKRHSIQIEFNRALYMDEKSFTKKSNDFERLESNIRAVLASFSAQI